MSGHETFREWDAAYLLGALTAKDRRAFENHLETCAQCRASVGELSPLPGLLARIRPQSDLTLPPEPAPTDGAAAADRSEPAEADREDWSAEPKRDDLAEADPPSHRPPKRGILTLSALAAVIVLVLAIVIPTAILDRNEVPAPTESSAAVEPTGATKTVTVALAPVEDRGAGDVPDYGEGVPDYREGDTAGGSGTDQAGQMSVKVELESVAWGTRLSIVCEYPPTSSPPNSSPPAGHSPDSFPPSSVPAYGLILTDDTGAAREVSTWSAVPGRTIDLTASTALELDDISELTVVTSAGAPLLTATLPPPER